MIQTLKQFPEFPNILIHSGEYTSKTGSSEVTFKVENYQFEVLLVLSKLRWKWTGWAVLCEILRNNPRKMIIQPFLDGFQSLSPSDTNQQAIDKLKSDPNFNAYAEPAFIAQATPNGKTALVCGGPFSNQSMGTIGTGTGSDSTINFSPRMWIPTDVGTAFGKSVGPGTTKDEVLLHEIVHGLRQMNGKYLCSATPDNRSLDNVEEFMAIVISNVYRSELGFSDLRADHSGFSKLSPELTDPQRFIDKDRHLPTNNYTRLIQLKKEHPKLCEDLKQVTASFNPFKLI